MSKPRKGKPVSYEQALTELPAAEQQVRELSADFQNAFDSVAAEMQRLCAGLAQERAKLLAPRLRVDHLRNIVSKGRPAESKQALVFELVPNPMITQGLIDAVLTGEVETKHEASKIAAINEVLLVGGLARVKNKTPAQFLAASKYCELFERSQIGGAKAQDYSQVRVDTSGPRQDQISAQQDDDRTEFDGARKSMGERATSIVDQVVVYGASIRSMAVKLGHGEGGQGRVRAEKELLAAVDVLVSYFKLLPSEIRKPHRWSDGERLPLVQEDGEAA